MSNYFIGYINIIFRKRYLEAERVYRKAKIKWQFRISVLQHVKCRELKNCRPFFTLNGNIEAETMCQNENRLTGIFLTEAVHLL